MLVVQTWGAWSLQELLVGVVVSSVHEKQDVGPGTSKSMGSLRGMFD